MYSKSKKRYLQILPRKKCKNSNEQMQLVNNITPDEEKQNRKLSENHAVNGNAFAYAFRCKGNIPSIQKSEVQSTEKRQSETVDKKPERERKMEKERKKREKCWIAKILFPFGLAL